MPSAFLLYRMHFYPQVQLEISQLLTYILFVSIFSESSLSRAECLDSSNGVIPLSCISKMLLKV